MRTKITSLLLIATLVAIVPPLSANADSIPDAPQARVNTIILLRLVQHFHSH